ncbi:hypothetical protein CTAYLR_008990 [Chrysophaeum taylorii]|uniref:RGS domain-containing protein n=1 Tax=Chrysophaeum taylorii TaxID=2483200 RepID=A0AAD7UPS9_9STRA|nr:hypothetical protein CTAYLR_008990 [Chrysophaeum taylorii]
MAESEALTETWAKAWSQHQQASSESLVDGKGNPTTILTTATTGSPLVLKTPAGRAGVTTTTTREAVGVRSMVTRLLSGTSSSPVVASPAGIKGGGRPRLDAASVSWNAWRSERSLNTQQSKAVLLSKLLKNPSCRAELRHFLEGEFASESLEFWEAVEILRSLVDNKKSAEQSTAGVIFRKFIADGAPLQVNISSALRKRTTDAYDEYATAGEAAGGGEFKEEAVVVDHPGRRPSKAERILGLDPHAVVKPTSADLVVASSVDDGEPPEVAVLREAKQTPTPFDSAQREIEHALELDSLDRFLASPHGKYACLILEATGTGVLLSGPVHKYKQNYGYWVQRHCVLGLNGLFFYAKKDAKRAASEVPHECVVGVTDATTGSGSDEPLSATNTPPTTNKETLLSAHPHAIQLRVVHHPLAHQSRARSVTIALCSACEKNQWLAMLTRCVSVARELTHEANPALQLPAASRPGARLVRSAQSFLAAFHHGSSSSSRSSSQNAGRLVAGEQGSTGSTLRLHLTPPFPRSLVVHNSNSSSKSAAADFAASCRRRTHSSDSSQGRPQRAQPVAEISLRRASSPTPQTTTPSAAAAAASSSSFSSSSADPVVVPAPSERPPLRRGPRRTASAITLGPPRDVPSGASSVGGSEREGRPGGDMRRRKTVLLKEEPESPPPPRQEARVVGDVTHQQTNRDRCRQLCFELVPALLDEWSREIVATLDFVCRPTGVKPRRTRWLPPSNYYVFHSSESSQQHLAPVALTIDLSIVGAPSLIWLLCAAKHNAANRSAQHQHLLDNRQGTPRRRFGGLSDDETDSGTDLDDDDAADGHRVFDLVYDDSAEAAREATTTKLQPEENGGGELDVVAHTNELAKVLETLVELRLGAKKHWQHLRANLKVAARICRDNSWQVIATVRQYVNATYFLEAVRSAVAARSAIEDSGREKDDAQTLTHDDGKRQLRDQILRDQFQTQRIRRSGVWRDAMIASAKRLESFFEARGCSPRCKFCRMGVNALSGPIFVAIRPAVPPECADYVDLADSHDPRVFCWLHSKCARCEKCGMTALRQPAPWWSPPAHNKPPPPPPSSSSSSSLLLRARVLSEDRDPVHEEEDDDVDQIHVDPSGRVTCGRCARGFGDGDDEEDGDGIFVEPHSSAKASYFGDSITVGSRFASKFLFETPRAAATSPLRQQQQESQEDIRRRVEARLYHRTFNWGSSSESLLGGPSSTNVLAALDQ